MNVCAKVEPLNRSDSEETIRSAISFSSVLPPSGYDYTSGTPYGIEMAEKAQLSSVLGWSDPRGLFGYSETSEYKDLYVYFDYGDRTSPVNELATKAFKMYGLDGAMVRGKPTWGNIHGPVIIVRLEPDAQFSPNQVYNPTFTLEEIYRTLVFFRDAEASAHKIAAKRDNARFYKSQSGNLTNIPDGITYMGPAGVLRTSEQFKNDMDTCANCGKAQSLIGRLKKCTVCKKTYYCGKDCQVSHWKEHKKVCKTL